MIACQPQPESPVAAQVILPPTIAPEPTSSPTAADRPVVAVPSSPTPLATATPKVSATSTPDLLENTRVMKPEQATSPSSNTPASTATSDSNRDATAFALAAADPVDRTCPDPPPAKPEYRHAYLSSELLPKPDPGFEAHFWLAKPLPGGGRLLYTDWLPYGYDAGGRYLLHNGLDAAEPEGTPILAAADGTVVVAGDDYGRLYGWRCDWYGHLVVIELDRKWQGQPVYVLYGHVGNIAVEPGQRVSRGDKVAEVSFGGAAKLPHLHFEVRLGSNDFGSTRNPLLWLEPPTTRGLIAGRLVDPDGRPWQGVVVTAIGRTEGTENRTTWTYLGDPQRLINPDEGLAENFVIGDLKPGEYELTVEVQGEMYKQPVVVTAGQLQTAELVTLPYKTATPPPAEPTGETETATASATATAEQPD